MGMTPPTYDYSVVGPCYGMTRIRALRELTAEEHEGCNMPNGVAMTMSIGDHFRHVETCLGDVLYNVSWGRNSLV